MLAKILEYGLERLYYVDNVASNLRVTPRMFGRIHRSLTWACKILDVPEPELYVTVDPVPNAFTYGHTKPFITVTSGLIDMLTDEELFFVIGHEVGHIKAGHVLYGTMARNIAAVVTLLGQATLGFGALLGQGLVIALYEWYRCAELTADRAALLCVQDIEPARTTLMKLAGGTTRLAGGDGSRRVPAPGARVRGCRPIDARQGVQGAPDAVAHASRSRCNAPRSSSSGSPRAIRTSWTVAPYPLAREIGSPARSGVSALTAEPARHAPSRTCVMGARRPPRYRGQ